MRTAILLAGMLLSSTVLADANAISYVKTVNGEATITTAGKKVKAEVGTAIFQGSQLKTAAKGSMGITFKDETVMSFGPETELTVDEYLYNPSQNKLKLGSKLTKGSLNYVSGVIAKLQPSAVTVTTPTGTIGVRGTQFAVKVEE